MTSKAYVLAVALDANFVSTEARSACSGKATHKATTATKVITLTTSGLGNAYAIAHTADGMIMQAACVVAGFAVPALIALTDLHVRQSREGVTMAGESSTWMTTGEVATLADNLSQYGGKNSLATRLATMERQCPCRSADTGDAAAGTFVGRVQAAARRVICPYTMISGPAILRQGRATVALKLDRLYCERPNRRIHRPKSMPAAWQYYVVLDANIWIAERLLQSSIGSAFLYTVAGAQSSIVLPEVVELEIGRVLPDMAERAVGNIKRDLALLRQLSGHDLRGLIVPSALAIEEGIKERWEQLTGLLVRVPFTHDQAKSALQRVIRKAPPCGENNEQFRDCCIWDATVSTAMDRFVHLVSADNAFYENRNKTAGLASMLQAEVTAAGKDIRIHHSLKDFLEAVHACEAAIDETAIGKAIVEVVTDHVRVITAEKYLTWRHRDTAFDVGKAHQPKISGYATPKPSLIAISFEAPFDLERVVVEGDAKVHEDATMTLRRVCSYDPTTKELSEIEVREWKVSGQAPSGGTWGYSSGGTMSPDEAGMRHQYGPGMIRFI